MGKKGFNVTASGIIKQNLILSINNSICSQ